MHSAPAVSYPVGHSPGAQAVLPSIWLVGALGACQTIAHQGFDLRTGALLASVVVAGLAAWHFGGHRQRGQLRFDGQHWSWSGPLPLGAARAEVGLDLQFLLLVRLTEPGRARQWLWLERRSAPSRWRDLRRAVYSRAPTAPPADAPAQASALGAPPSYR